MSFFDECAGNIEQQNAYRMIANTNNSFFLTGKAGTGKSTFLRRICEEVKKHFVVLAPTGVAAMNIGGQTIHSFFGLSFGVQGPNNYGNINEQRIKLIRKIDTIIIDEISMVRCDLVDVMDRMLRRYRNNFQPFGGVQIVFVGDLFQLPPVITMADKALLRKFYNSTGYYFYDSNVIKNIRLPKIEFTKVYRQNDPAFIELLDRFRVGAVRNSDIAKLNTRVIDEELLDVDVNFRITLTTRRDDASLINEARLADIKAPAFTYKATYSGDCSKCKDVVEDELTLKVGAQVMFIRNIRKSGCVNGTIGVVSELAENKIIVELENGRLCEVEKEVWEAIEYEYSETSKVVGKKVVGKLTQYPLRLAWAITIHKSQSLTFDKVAINLGRGSFTFGQTYVALSRARSIAGIDLMQHVNPNSIMVSKEILSFAKEFNDEKIISNELEIGEAISHYENMKDYDLLAITLCKLAGNAIKRNDIKYAYDLVSRGSPGKPADLAESHRRQPESSLCLELCKPKRGVPGRKADPAAAVFRRQIRFPGRDFCRTDRRCYRPDGNLRRSGAGGGTHRAGLCTGAGDDLSGKSAQRGGSGSGLSQAAPAGRGRSPAASAVGKRSDPCTDHGQSAAGGVPQPCAAAVRSGHCPGGPADLRQGNQ